MQSVPMQTMPVQTMPMQGNMHTMPVQGNMPTMPVQGNMPMQGVPMQPMPMATCSMEPMQSDRKRKRRQSAAKSESDSEDSQAQEDDEQASSDSETCKVKTISRCYTRLGFQYRNSYPKKQRWSIVKGILADKLNPVTHSQLSVKALDQIIFVATGCAPTACIADFKSAGARKVGKLKDMLIAESMQQKRRPHIAQMTYVALRR